MRRRGALRDSGAYYGWHGWVGPGGPCRASLPGTVVLRASGRLTANAATRSSESQAFSDY
ncbi:hypothetical protein E2C01_022422 [Portunus trituberculatus]|uniref:Uncharacterized protein n=1 Tax=Portunus trituberculatus TaxID=210409 RepID=A0A5B7E5E4_PORTR|nr:hypothetical protein [Portunus trituberculatus]